MNEIPATLTEAQCRNTVWVHLLTVDAKQSTVLTQLYI